MADLRDDLRALSADVAWPPTPDLTTPFLHPTREKGSDPFLQSPREKGSDPLLQAMRRKAAGRWARRRRLVVAVALLVLALPAAALAITPTRHAILDALGLRHVTVERRLAPRRGAVDPRLGQATTLAAAARAAGFTPLVPRRLGAPDHVHRLGSIITFTYDRPEDVLLAQARGEGPRPEMLIKIIAIDDRAARTTVDGRPALWLGAPHSYQWSDATGPVVRSGPALVWERDGTVLRLEGVRTLARARAIAASVS
jgi:hypothetical protein